MWIVDVQLPLDASSNSPKGWRSIVLEDGRTYKLGRGADCDISVNLKKVSRIQTLISIDEPSGDLSLKNVGHATWIYDKGEELKGGCNDSIVLSRNTSLKLRSTDWKFDVFKLPAFKISSRIGSSLHDSIHIKVDDTLDDDHAYVGDDCVKIKSATQWIKLLQSRDWETKGGLAGYVIPDYERETEKENMTIRSMDDAGSCITKTVPEIIDLESVPESQAISKIGIPLDVEIKPITSEHHYSLANRLSRKNRKSQLDRYFDEMDDLDDLDTYTSQNTQPTTKFSQLTQPLPIVEETKKAFSKLDLNSASKRDMDSEPEAAERKVKKIKPIPKHESDTLPGNMLADIFKMTKKIKMDKISRDEQLLQTVNSGVNAVKTKKFQVKFENRDNPKIYSGYKMSYKNDPTWENRLNFSKFTKINNGDNYNPIMDSTIKTVKFKNSKYKSNELQVNLNQNDDMIPDLDAVLSPNAREPSTASTQSFSTSRKRRREPTLFVESDYEDTQLNDRNESSYESALMNTNHTANNRNPDNDTSSNKEPLIDSHSDSCRSKGFYKISGNTEDDADDDDTPVFKSRRR